MCVLQKSEWCSICKDVRCAAFRFLKVDLRSHSHCGIFFDMIPRTGGSQNANVAVTGLTLKTVHNIIVMIIARSLSGPRYSFVTSVCVLLLLLLSNGSALSAG